MVYTHALAKDKSDIRYLIKIKMIVGSMAKKYFPVGLYNEWSARALFIPYFISEYRTGSRTSNPGYIYIAGETGKLEIRPSDRDFAARSVARGITKC